jgi:hypothetical protein
MVAGASNKTIRLMPGIIWNPETPDNGVIRTASVGGEFPSVDGTASQFAASGEPRSIETLLHFMRSVPTKIVGMRVKSTDATQLDQRLYITKESPFNQTDKTKSLNLANYTNEYANNDKIATIPFTDQLDNQTKLDLVVVPGSTLTITFYFGDMLNLAAEHAQV